MTPAIKLKPCPFCGSRNVNYEFVPDQGRKWGRVACGCGACGPDVRTGYKDADHWAERAAEAWNERHEEPVTEGGKHDHPDRDPGRA